MEGVTTGRGAPGIRVKAQSELTGDCESAAEMTAPHAKREVTAWEGLTEMLGKLTGIGSAFDVTVSPISETINEMGNTLDKLTKPVEVGHLPPAAATL